MESNLYPEDWGDIVNQTYPIEFGWIGIDSLKHVGYFSTFNRAYTPKKVLSSYEEYVALANFINNLPEISTSQLFTKDTKVKFDNWHFHSMKGIFAYDYSDASRETKDYLYRYDLLTVPDTPVKIDEIAGIEEFMHMIPRFDLIFSDNITFEDLQNREL